MRDIEFGWAVVGPFARTWQHGSAAPFVSTDLAAALARPDVPAVYVATPHPFHAGPVRTSLAAGKPELCEKPMTVNAVGTRALMPQTAHAPLRVNGFEYEVEEAMRCEHASVCAIRSSDVRPGPQPG